MSNAKNEDPDRLYARWREEGDPRSLGELFDLAAPDLFRVAMGLTPDSALAEDALMETFLATLDRDGPGPRGSVLPWLAGILRNQVRRLARSGRRAPDPRRLASRARPPDPGEAAARDEATGRVRAAIDELPEPYREMAVLRWRYGLAPTAIADAKGMPPGTVRSLLSRAAARLRKRLRASSLVLFGIRAPRGPAALRRELVGRAAAVSPLGPVLVVGGILVTKKTMLLAALLVLLLAGAGTWLALPPAAPGPRPPATAPAPAVPSARVDAGGSGASTPAAAGGTPAASGAGESSTAGPGAAAGRVDVAVRWPDGTPAAGIHLRLIAWDGPDPLNRSHPAVTGEDGTASIAGVPSGRVTVYLGRGGSKTLVFGAGESARLSLDLAAGTTLDGVVVDPAGRAVPGAGIWLSESGNPGRGTVVARAGTDGRFRVRDVGPYRHVRAIAPGYAPSESVEVTGERSRDTREIRLVLPGPGGRVEGRVTSTDGEPVADAWVVAGGAPGSPVAGFETRTDSDGRFALDGLAPGEAAMGVRAPGLAPFAGTVKIRAGEATPADVRLSAAALVSGTVRTADGEPAAGAQVVAGRYGDFSGGTGYTDASGRYRLVDLPPGPADLHVKVRGVGFAARSLDLRAGAEEHWDPVLTTGGVVQGTVTDGAGGPRAGYLVMVSGIVGFDPVSESARTGPDGSFRVTNVRTDRATVEVFAPGAAFASSTRRDVPVGGGPLAFEVPDADLPAGRLTGLILGTDGRPAARVRVLVSLAGTGAGQFFLTDRAGRFSAGPLPAGGIVVQASPVAGPRLALAELTLAAGEERDLGTFRLQAAGRIEVTLRREDGQATRAAFGTVLGGGPAVSVRFAGKPVATTGPVTPGRHFVRATDFGADRSFVGEAEVIVDAEKTAKVVLLLRPALRREFRVLDGKGELLRTRIGLRIENDAGDPVLDGPYPAGGKLDLLPGTYTFTVTGPDGARAEERFTVREADAGPFVLRLP